MKRFASSLILLLALFSLLLAIPNIQIVKTQSPYNTATIRADGTIDPATAPIQRVGDVYTLIGDMDRIAVERNNMILDGNGHTLTPYGAVARYAVHMWNVNNVTIKNLIINGGEVGISLDRCSNVTISGNTITGVTVPVPELQATGGIYVWAGGSHIIYGNHLENNMGGIYLGYETTDNIIVENNITNNIHGIQFWEASGNIFYHNRIINNTVQVFDSGVVSPDYASPSVNNWDNGTTGNYWSDYNGTDNNSDGIGDTPHIIDENNQDRYPLMDEGGKFEPYVSTFHLLFEDGSHKLLGNLSVELRITEPEKEIIHSICKLSLSSPRLDEYHEPYTDKVELFMAWFFTVHLMGPHIIPQPPPQPQKVTVDVDEEIILFEHLDNVSGFENEPRVVTWFMETKIKHHEWGSLILPTIRVYFSDGQKWEWTYEDNGTIPFKFWPEMDVNLSELSGKILTATITLTTVEKVNPLIITSVRLIILASIIVAIVVAAVFVKYRKRAWGVKRGERSERAPGN